MLYLEGKPDPSPPQGIFPTFFGSSRHTFESLAFSVFRLLLRDVKGPLAYYVVTTFPSKNAEKGGGGQGNDSDCPPGGLHSET